MDNVEDVNDVEMNNGNGVHNEEGKEVCDDYNNIGEMTDDYIREMEFESEEKACKFYDAYAEYHGFAARKDTKSHDNKGNINMRQLVCNREVERHKKHTSRVDRKRDPRPTTRLGCLARLRLIRNAVTKMWKVSIFVSVHNHKLTPQKFVHFIPKYRRVSEADKAFATGLRICGVRTCPSPINNMISTVLLLILSN